MPEANIPLSLDTQRNFDAFFMAIEDKRARDTLQQDSNTTDGVKQLVQMVEDKDFIGLSSNAARSYAAYMQKRQQFPSTLSIPDSSQQNSDAKDVLDNGEKLKSYMSDQYPAAFELLKEYGRTVRPETGGALGGPTPMGFAAYVETLVNAAVYANVAAATFVAVAAAAVVVIAAVVI